MQSVQGYVSQAGIQFCAEQLNLSNAEVSAVATFYTMYKRKPCGEHLVSVCTNTLCAVLGGDAIYKKLQEHLGEDGKPLGHEETAGEPGLPGSITLEHAECLAACDLGPVLQVNYEFYDNQTPDSAVELVDALRKGEKPAPTRGAPLTDFKSVERQLAGPVRQRPRRVRCGRSVRRRGNAARRAAGRRPRLDRPGCPEVPACQKWRRSDRPDCHHSGLHRCCKRWLSPNSWRLSTYEQLEGYTACARRSPARPSSWCSWSRTPACAAAAARASRPASSGRSCRPTRTSRTTW